jgi:hypothetical protein
VDDHAGGVDYRTQGGCKPFLEIEGSARRNRGSVRDYGAFSHLIAHVIERFSECVYGLLMTESVDQLLRGLKTEQPIDARELA